MNRSLASIVENVASAPGATITLLMKTITAAESVGSLPAHKLAKEVAVTTGARAALARLADKVETMDLPRTRRELEEEEQHDLVDVLADAKEVGALVKAVETSVRTALMFHLDCEAEAHGAVNSDTPRDKDNHYLVAGEGYGFRRSPVAGTPSVSVELLLDLVAEGVITRAQFLAMTESVRVIKEAGFLAFVAKHPNLIGALRRAIKFSRRPSLNLDLS